MTSRALLIASAVVVLAACGQQTGKAQAATTFSYGGHAVALPSMTASDGSVRSFGSPAKITAKPAMPVATTSPR